MIRICLTICLLLGALPADEQQDALVKELEQSLMAPCCWSGTVYDHGHAEMSRQIRTLVAEGKTKAEIMTYFVDQYGERILATPKAEGFNLMAWIAPLLIALLGVGVLVKFLKTPRSTPPPAPSKTETAGIPYDAQIERELKDLD